MTASFLFLQADSIGVFPASLHALLRIVRRVVDPRDLMAREVRRPNGAHVLQCQLSTTQSDTYIPHVRFLEPMRSRKSS